MELGFKKLTQDNWSEHDPILGHFVHLDRKTGHQSEISKEEWAANFLTPKFGSGIPIEVVRLYEVAGGRCSMDGTFTRCIPSDVSNFSGRWKQRPDLRVPHSA